VQKVITDDMDALLEIMPPLIKKPLVEQKDISELLEVVLDLGRQPEARFPKREEILSKKEVEEADIDYIVARISKFGDDNRAGIERTLHRISAIRNRRGRIVGLTCRVGRAVFGTIKVIEDLVESGKSVLLLGRPGVGKTTMLREVARVLAVDAKKRVIIVDTSNEIAGDGDIPHPAIGHARRMQVATPSLQHAVMIEAVENHMPEVIVIDEIGTELEAMAARTIAERGVQLVGTAHGNTLENLMMNPTLADLIGGIQSVTLGDEEARRRGTQKSILERKSPPTFDIVVEIQERDRVAIHSDVGEAVDALLRGTPPHTEVRWLDEQGEVKKEKAAGAGAEKAKTTRIKKGTKETKPTRLYLFGVNRGRLIQVAREMGINVEITENLRDAGTTTAGGRKRSGTPKALTCRSMSCGATRRRR
jgi:stage III sporulation protein SpoIIIAA